MIFSNEHCSLPSGGYIIKLFEVNVCECVFSSWKWTIIECLDLGSSEIGDFVAISLNKLLSFRTVDPGKLTLIYDDNSLSNTLGQADNPS